MFVVDAFTSRPFSGNPAGVCLLTELADGDWMQRVASEMKHAETAFIVPDGDAFGLRWFTPSTEVDLCGHATLAAAHILWEADCIEEDEAAIFHTKSGTLTCTRHGYGIQMDFPVEPVGEPIDGSEIVKALRLSGPSQTYQNRMDYLVEVPDAATLRLVEPDMEALTALGGRGVIVTAQSDSAEYDFLSRFFAPAAGIPEDPVTGSAHCCLGPYWARKLGKNDLTGYQCSERGGTVRVAIRGDRVLLQGHALTTLRGEFLV
jgi:PhzF family phenazine biosynthesis protein